MCILFFYNNPNASTNQYRFILASNRDEYYYRPTKPADYWDQNCTVIAGRDLESDEQGTWLALSAKGKIATVLNVWCPEKTDNAKSRGGLPIDYVNSNCCASEFIDNISKNGYKYNGYNLLLFDVGTKTVNVTYSTNKEPSSGYYHTQLPSDGIHAFGNTVISSPLEKVVNGKSMFTDVVNKFNFLEQKDQLLNNLLRFLKSTERFPLSIDYDLLSHRAYREHCGSIFVKFPEFSYGTRSHTIILLDTDGNIEYHEWTMNFTAEMPNESQWTHKEFKLRLLSE